MKRRLQVILSASAVSLLSLSIQAETPGESNVDKTSIQNPKSRLNPTRQINGAAKTSDVIGMTVKTRAGEAFGKVEDIAVDIESGRILQVILSAENTYTAIPPELLHHKSGDKFLQLDVDKDKIATAPHVEIANWGAINSSEHLAQVYRTFGQEKAFDFIHQDEAGVYGMIPAGRLNHVQKATKLIGTSVKNLQNDTLGKVDNMVVDLPSGRILAVIISSGGFLGIGEELSALPPASLRFAQDWETIQLDTSKEVLRSAPHFKSGEWPDFTKSSVSIGVYQAYKAEPYFDAAPDNTSVNVRDSNDKNLTPLDQGNNAADLDLSTQIRKEVLARKEISVNAHNVKIITVKRRVTLRGPVDTTEEKRIISDIADRIARPENVDNLLEVNPKSRGN